MKLKEKIAKAKEEIKATKLKKEGKNTFSNYSYFTPTQIEFLVQNACVNNRLLTVFDLERNELGVTGWLTVYDLDSDEYLKTAMATGIPELKGTNLAQQLGGSMTYTERYLKTSLFGITDNNLDFDNHKPKEQVIKSLSDATTLIELSQIWVSMTTEEKKLPENIELKDKLKDKLK